MSVLSDLVIEARGLRKTFDDVVACDTVDITVEPGQIVGLVGPDGAGKTTTMRMLCGIVSADDGTAIVAGHDPATEAEAVHSRVGYLPQAFSLHRHLTVSENVAYSADLHEVPPEVWRQRAEELLQKTALFEFQDRPAGQLSGGMRQKLSLVCTLIHRPEAVLLDEPTTGVDPVSRREFWKILYDIPSDGVGMLVSTPYMDEAARCNQVTFMHRGNILAFDTPQGLRDAIEHSFFELRPQRRQRVQQILVQDASIESVEVFGERLHVAMKSGSTADDLRTILDDAELSVEHIERIEPTLEDAFMTMASDDAPDG